ncbi:MAG: glycosyltransferase family 2 protein [bacterium]
MGADVKRGKNQKPFDGKVYYDYIMWIDSDIIFTVEQFQKLLIHKKDIMSGLYYMEGGRQFATVADWDEEYFKKNGYFKFLQNEDIDREKDKIEVSYTGMGFMLVKSGVFESMEYPWFRPINMKIGEMVDFTMEDVAFCIRAKEKGYKIYVDPNVIVGHEKRIIL